MRHQETARQQLWSKELERQHAHLLVRAAARPLCSRCCTGRPCGANELGAPNLVKLKTCASSALCCAAPIEPLCVNLLCTGAIIRSDSGPSRIMDADLRKQMQARWEASQAAGSAPAAAASDAENSVPPASEAESSGTQPDKDAIKAKQAAEMDEYRRAMAERYARNLQLASAIAQETSAAPSAPEGASEPTAPRSPRTAARELREQQDREFQQALAADQAAEEGDPPRTAAAPHAASSTASAPISTPTSGEEELRRRQVADLRARRSQEALGVAAEVDAVPSDAAVGNTMVRDAVTGEQRHAGAQGRVQRLTDGMSNVNMGLGVPAMPQAAAANTGGGGGRPELPAQLRQALTQSQLDLLYEAMGEAGGMGGFAGLMPGAGGLGAGMPPSAEMGALAPRLQAPPLGGPDDEEGMPSNWDPRNARQTESEQDIHRRQVAELRARRAGQAPPPAPNSSSTSRVDAEAAAQDSGGMVVDPVTGESRPAAAQGRMQRLVDDEAGAGMMGAAGYPVLPGMGAGEPMTLREMALREQAMEGYGPPGRGGMPPWAQFGREPEGYEELSALSERIGDVSRGVPTATVEQNSFTFDYEPPAAGSELAAQAANDVTLARCSVCLCDLERGECCRRLPCLHMFHKDCIDDWLKRNRSCPVCKTDIVTGAAETRREMGEQQCSAAAMPGEPDWQPPGFGDDDPVLGQGMPPGLGLGPARQRSQPGVGFAQPSPTMGAAGGGSTVDGTMGTARGYFDPRAGPGMQLMPGDPVDGPPAHLFGGIRGNVPPLGVQSSASAAAAAARAAQARAEASSAPSDDAPGGAAEMVLDEISGEIRPAAAQGRVERLDGLDEGDLWRGMQGMGIGGGPTGGIQARGFGAFPAPYGNRGPAVNPYYEDMFRSRGPLGALRSAESRHGGMGPLGGTGFSGPGVGPGGAHAEQLLRQARLQQQMAFQAMGHGAPGEGPSANASGGRAEREWGHFWQGR